MSTELLEELGGSSPSQNPAVTMIEGNGFDVAGFIATHGLDVDGPFDWEGEQGPGQKWTFRGRAPLCGDHEDDNAAVILKHAGGAVSAKCHHGRCDWGWPELAAYCRSQFLGEAVASSNGEAVLDIVAETGGDPYSSMAGKPQLMLPCSTDAGIEVSGRLGRLLDESGRYYLRGDTVTMVGTDSKGKHRCIPIQPVRFRTEIETVCQPRKQLKIDGEWIHHRTICPKEVAAMLLESTSLQRELPEIRVLSECPLLLNEGGELVEVSGYHRPSGTLATSADISHVTLECARKLIDELLQDFDFGSDGDLARAMAAIFTPALLLGSLLGGRAPVVFTEADQSQSGKGYFVRLVSAVYNQEPFIVTQRKGGVGSFDENLSMALLSRKSFVSADNIEGKMRSTLFESCLTENSVSPRVPHGKLIDIDPSAICFFMTSNGANVAPDSANRSSIIRILKRPRRYRYREYSGPRGDLLEHVQKNWRLILGGVFAVIRAWDQAGRPLLSQSEADHDFRPWSRSAGWIVPNLLKGPALMAGHVAAQQRMASGSLSWLRALALAVKAGGLLGEELTAGDILDVMAATDVKIPDLHQTFGDRMFPDYARNGITGQIAKRMKACLRGADETIVDRVRIRCGEKKDEKSYVKAFYVFTEDASASPSSGLKDEIKPGSPDLVPGSNHRESRLTFDNSANFEIPTVTEAASNKEISLESLEQTSSSPEEGVDFQHTGENYNYFFWKNETLAGEVISLDTETVLIDDNVPGHVPTLVLATASDGVQNCVIHPSQLADFILAHADRQFVGHNMAEFDFGVVEQFLTAAGEDAARAAWWQIAEENRLHDTQIMDQLNRLGKTDEFPRRRTLDVLSEQLADIKMDKAAGADPENDIPGYRLRYAELIDAPWDKVAVDEPGWFDYAVLDSVATLCVYRALEEEGIRLAEPYAGDILPDAAQRFGLLTEAIQVKGAIALKQLERRGLAIDQEQAKRTEALIREKLDAHAAALEATEEGRGIFKRNKQGQVLINPKTGTPKKSDKAVRALLEKILDDSEDGTIIPPRTPKTGEIQLTADF